MTFTNAAPTSETQSNSENVRTISVLGATGSIGDSTLAIVAHQPDRYKVIAVTGGSNAEKLAKIARDTSASIVAIADESKVSFLKEALADLPCEVLGGDEGVLEAARAPCEMTISSIVGFAGLGPTLAALDACRYLSLANKESLVCAGSLVMGEAAKKGVTVLPLDSEHNAIHQALLGDRIADVEMVTLTASGGPFRTWSRDDIAKAGPANALKHPNWSMGAKITIDSATLMNKGLEVIEAHHLFPIRHDQLDVVVHPQSIIHGMVSFVDGAVLAELGCPDMRTPIAHCMAHPNRIETEVERLSLTKISQLTFEEPDLERFPMLRIAKQALSEGDVATNLINGANEVVVQHFLNENLSFYGMSDVVEKVLASGLNQFNPKDGITSYDQAVTIDGFARSQAAEFITSLT
ncbi:MAG: 1-deoxy-D-xylulose-5-phosphate reductoisomerase [Hyphomicrobiales bacterium]